MSRKLSNEFALSAAVPLPKGVQRVEFAEIIGQAYHEFVFGQAYEMVLSLEFSKKRMGRLLQIGQ